MRRFLVPLILVTCLVLPAGAGAGEVGPRVINGDKAEPGDWPWQVALLRGGGLRCGGTLISSQHVLTAAHCTPITSDQVRVGSLDRTTGGQLIGIDSVTYHPLADPNFPHHDIAVVRLVTAETHADAEPLTVVSTSEGALWADGTNFWVTGWGVTDDETVPPTQTNDLMEADVPRVSDASCTTAYGSDFQPSNMVCAADFVNVEDTCQGDSGGPMVAQNTASPDQGDPDHWRLVGVTSWGIGCAQPGFPGVYARVGAAVLRDWIALVPLTAAPGRPTVSGAAVVGQVVTCAAPAFTGGPALLTYRFFRRDVDGAVRQIAHTASDDYRVRSLDAGQRLFCRVEADNAVDHEQSQNSADSAQVTPVPVPQNLSAPALSGAAQIGDTITCRPGDWSREDSVTSSIRRIGAGGTATWLVNVPSGYTVAEADAGSSFECLDVATNKYGSAEAGSGHLGPVAAPAPPSAPPPVTLPLAVDRTAPVTSLVRRRCARRRCTVHLRVRDSGDGATGVARVGAIVRWTERGRARRRTLRAVRTGGLHRIRTPRLRRGRYVLQVVVTDRTGNARTRRYRLLIR